STYTDVTIESAGTLALTGDTTVSGNWTNNGGTLTGNYRMTFDGATGQTVTGDTTFYQLTKSVTSPQTMNFTAGSTTTVSNQLTFSGAAGQLLSLRSTTDGTQWKINAPTSRSASYVNVKDSDASAGSAITALHSVDGGNNVNWSFPADAHTIT